MVHRLCQVGSVHVDLSSHAKELLETAAEKFKDKDCDKGLAKTIHRFVSNIFDIDSYCFMMQDWPTMFHEIVMLLQNNCR